MNTDMEICPWYTIKKKYQLANSMDSVFPLLKMM